MTDLTPLADDIMASLRLAGNDLLTFFPAVFGMTG
jgi:hypothetical protein